MMSNSLMCAEGRGTEARTELTSKLRACLCLGRYTQAIGVRVHALAVCASDAYRCSDGRVVRRNGSPLGLTDRKKARKSWKFNYQDHMQLDGPTVARLRQVLSGNDTALVVPYEVSCDELHPSLSVSHG